MTHGNVPITVKEVPDLIGDGNLDLQIWEDIQNNRFKNTGNPNEACNLKANSLDEKKMDELLLYLRSLSYKIEDGSIQIKKRRAALRIRKI